MFSRLLKFAAVLACLCAFSVFADDEKIRVDIPAQDLSGALTQFGREAGTEIVFTPQSVHEKKAPAVKGEFGKDEALRILLQGSGLVYRMTAQGAIVVEPSRTIADASMAELAQTSEFAVTGEGTPNGVDKDAASISEIVVTAQKRVERLIDAPISIGVLAGSDLERSGARGISDALNQVGGVNLIEMEPGRSTISIRGASAGSITLTGSSPVGYYLDELPFSWISNAIVPDANAFDLERVEVLRGPQGTLYGASSLNGAVRILSNDANLSEFQIGGRLRTGWTDDGDASQSGDLMINLPLVTDRLAVRAVASYADIGGYIDTATTPDFNDSEIQNYRLKVNAKPTDRLSIELGTYFSRIANNGAPAAFDDYTTNLSDNQGGERDYDAYNLIVTHQFPSFTVLSSTGYIDVTGKGAFDVVFPPTASLTDNLSAESFTEEVRINLNFEGAWRLSGGVFYRTIEQVLHQSVLAFFPNPLEFTDKSDSYAVFGEVTRAFMDDRLEITGGIRYFEDTVKTTEQSTLANGTAGPFIAPREADFDAVTWRTVLAYHPSENQTLYGSVATGFRSGFNQAATSLAVEPTLSDIKPDDLITYEVGYKGASSDGRLLFDTAAYYTNWNDTQQLRPTAIRTAAVINAESVNGFGVDASFTARPTDDLTVNANMGWNSLEFDANTFITSPAGTFVLLPEGDRMNISPELTVGLGAQYAFPLGGSALQGFFAADARYTSRVIRHDVVAGVPVRRVFDNIYDTNLRFGIQSDDWTVSAFAENVLNENGAMGEASGQALPAAARQRPRTIGLQVSFKFQ